MKRFLIVFLLGLLVGAPAFAADIQCYSPAELQAEQLLRLHSQLMVITLTCKQSSWGQDLVPAYTGFTKRNIEALRNAEQTMIRYYYTHYGDQATAHLDQLRTRLGNEYGQEIADETAPLFCRAYRDKVIFLSAVTPAELQTRVQAMTVSEKSYERLCPATVPTRIANQGR